YDDQNAIVRQKIHATALRRMAPLLNTIVKQGIDEGVFHLTDPELMGEMILALSEGMNDAVARLLLTNESLIGLLAPVQRIMTTYTEALERILGSAPGFITLTD